MTPREIYVQAKAEHYLERAEECCAMGRYPAARRAIDQVVALEPGNQVCAVLKQTVEEQFNALLRHTSRGIAHADAAGTVTGNDNGNGQGNGNGRRNGASGNHRGDLIVVVDQDERLLSQLAAALPRHGYSFAGAASYDEAVELLSLITPDIVVSEVNFDCGARGCDLFSWMRTHSALAQTPFMFQATRLDSNTLLAGKRFGVDDFLLKPVDGAVLAAAAMAVLHRRRSVPVPA